MKQNLPISDRFTSRAFFIQHLAAYEFVRQFARDRVILDAGTGDGYGAYYLSNVAREIIGIDIKEEPIEKARQNYAENNLKFLIKNVLYTDFPDGHFDIVISSQVIEHIEMDKLNQYLDELSRVLKKDGVFFVSTLNLIRNLKGRNLEKYDKSPHHVKEFTPLELKNFLLSHFSKVEILGLHANLRNAFFAVLKKSGIFKKIPNKFSPIKMFYDNLINLNDFSYSSRNLNNSINLMGICRK